MTRPHFFRPKRAPPAPRPTFDLVHIAVATLVIVTVFEVSVPFMHILFRKDNQQQFVSPVVLPTEKVECPTSVTPLVIRESDTMVNSGSISHAERANVVSKSAKKAASVKPVNPAAITQPKAAITQPKTELPSLLSPESTDPCSASVCVQVRRSTLHRACCIKADGLRRNTKVYPLLITATPRSGTNTALALFNELGMDLGSDWGSIGRDGRASWIHVFSEYDHVEHPNNVVALPYFGKGGQQLGQRYQNMVQLLRDPLQSITSIACTEPIRNVQWSEFVRTHIKTRGWMGRQVSDFSIAMLMWREWHRFIATVSSLRVKVEDLLDEQKAFPIVTEVFSMLDREPPSYNTTKSVLSRIRPRNGRSHRPPVTWDALFRVDPELASDVLELSRYFGYAYPGVDAENLKAQATTGGQQPRPTCIWAGETERGKGLGKWSTLPLALRPWKNW